MSPAWIKLYMDIVKKAMTAAEKSHHHQRMLVALDEKELDAQELYRQEKEAIRARRYKGTVPTESVNVSYSPAGNHLHLRSLCYSSLPLSLQMVSLLLS